MQEDFRLIIDLVTVLGIAAIGGLLAALMKQPTLLGYLIGGMIVGPAGLGWIKEVVQVETLAQFGVAFLLFTLGVSFSLSEIKKVQGISLGGGILQILLTILVTTGISLWVGWVNSPQEGVFLGAILSLSSTAVVLRSLMDSNSTNTPPGQVMLGILVVQDLAVGLMLAVLPALDQPPEELGIALAWALAQIALIAGGAVIAGIWLIPPLLRLLAQTESRELFLLGVVALCLGIALLTDRLGLSIEIGAFIAGLMISEVEYADQTLSYVEPLRDIFATLFFAAIGMLIDPVFLWNHWELILGLVALVIIGKFCIITPIVKLFGYSWKTALITGIGLTQIGEFSFVLASEGQSLGLVSRQVYLLILGTTAVTLIVTPFLLKALPLLMALPWFQAWFQNDDRVIEMGETELPQQNHLIVCGYGRVGQSIVQLLREQNYPVLVIDQSEEAIQKLRQTDIPYLYGNASSPTVLEKAGVSQALGMAIALSDSMSTRLCLKRGLEFAPELDVIVRANQDKDIELLYQLGAREVVQPEFEASLELAAHLLFSLGLSEPKIQRQVQNIRNRHYQDLRGERSAMLVSRELRQAARDLNSQWQTLADNSPVLGMSLKDIELRQLTGATLLAVMRADGTEIDYPGGETKLQAGDRLLITGQPTEIKAAQALFSEPTPFTTPILNGGHGNGDVIANLWLMLPLDSAGISCPLGEVGLPQGVIVQALRRDGVFSMLPNADIILEGGDRLLLRGAVNDLTLAGDILTARSVLLASPQLEAV